MSGLLVTSQTMVQCLHGGMAAPGAPNPRVTVNGAPTLLVPTTHAIAGCTLINTIGNPFCVTGIWTAGSKRVTSNNQALVITTGQSKCINTNTQLLVPAPQQKVSAT
jgi:hypothetical protein